MPAYYKVILKDTNGVQVDQFDSWNTLSFENRVNEPGSFSLAMLETNVDVSHVQIDGQIEIHRMPYGGTAWALEFEGIITGIVRETTSNGLQTFTINGAGYLDLLARRVVAYNEGTVQADKSAPAETCMKEYVNENAGPSAGSFYRTFFLDDGVVQYYNGITPGLSISGDNRKGPTWTGTCSFENLLDVIQKIALTTGVDFALIGSGPAKFTFYTFENGRGSDRSTVGLNPSTHVNAAGNAPVIFSVEANTVKGIQYNIEHRGSSNAIAVVGQGEKSTRKVMGVENATAQLLSPFARREATRSANMELEDDLHNEGLLGLKELAAVDSFTFQPMQQEGLQYGKDYFLGDKVTARYVEIEKHSRIMAVNITVADEDEQIGIEFGELK